MELPLLGRLIISVVLAGALSYAATPLAILVARRLAFYDVPAGYKGHRLPTPYLGGAAVTLAFAATLLVALPPTSARTLALLGGVTVMFAVGTVDDRRTLSPQLRMAIEFALGVLLSTLGHGWHVGSTPALNAVVNGAWVVAVVNAFNLFDNMDGAASTMACVAAAGAGTLGWLHHDAWAVAASAALCGACLGFLPHNLARPARIFLGDGGSLPVGFAVAALVASTARGAEPSILGLITGLLLVGLPALDTCLVIVSRRRRGVSILTAGQDHLTHRTRRRLLSARRVALVLGSVQALVSGLVIVASRAGSATLVYVLLAFVVCATVAIVGLEQATAETASSGAGAAPVVTGRLSEPWSDRVSMVGLAVLGLGAGISPFFSSYYNTGVWLVLGLFLTLAAAAAAVGLRPRVTSPVALAFTGVAGLGLWSLASSSWARGAESATVDANRWLTYSALLLLLLVLVRSRRHVVVLFGAIGIGLAVVAASVLARMLGTDPGSLFLAGRLNAPLGYINGEGCAFALACWFSLALAERREAGLAGLGAGASVAFACLTLLSQSRGAAVALFVAVLVALVVIPGARRRVLALALVAAGVALAASTVVRVYSSGQAGALSASVAHRAAVAIILAAAVVGVIWAAAVALTARLERRQPSAAIPLQRVASVLAALIIAAPVAAAVVESSTIERTLRTQWNAFAHLSDAGSASPGASQTRLFSGAGNRYDYWRIAWHTFIAHPIGGVGADNYAAAYYRDRRTQESIENPHSLELQTLAELGVVGAVLLAAVLAGVALGMRRMRRAARRSPGARTAMVAATGAAVVWLVDTSGDWMHLLPGVSAVALAAVAVLCRPDVFESAPDPRAARAAERGSPVRVGVLAGTALAALVLAVSGASLVRAGLVRHYVDQAHAELATHPADAITDANRALRLDGANLTAYEIKAAGEARFDQAGAARSTLLAAAREDPDDFVTWTLLGDLEVRLHNFSAARAFYGHAHELDPNDPTIATLAAHPASALASLARK